MVHELSPEIQPTLYDRPEGEDSGRGKAKRFTFSGIDHEQISKNPRVVQYADGMVAYHTESGMVFIDDGHVYVTESMYRSNPMPFVREFVLDALSELDDDGIVNGLVAVSTSKQ